MSDYQARAFHQREQAILAAALALFDSDGWQDVTVEQIARAVGIAKGTIYRHFPSKEEVYARLALEVHDASVRRLEALATDIPAEERVEQIVAVFWERTALPLAVQRVVQYCAREDFQRRLLPDSSARFADLDRRIAAVVADALRAGIREGSVADRPLPLLLFPAQAALTGAIQMAWGGCLGEAAAEAYRRELVRFILAGLAPAGAAVEVA